MNTSSRPIIEGMFTGCTSLSSTYKADMSNAWGAIGYSSAELTAAGLH